MEYVYPLLIGLVAGWLAGIIMGGKGGLLRNLIIGLIGGVIGGILLPKLGVSLTSDTTVNALISSTAGAVVLLFLVQFLGGKS